MEVEEKGGRWRDDERRENEMKSTEGMGNNEEMRREIRSVKEK